MRQASPCSLPPTEIPASPHTLDSIRADARCILPDLLIPMSASASEKMLSPATQQWEEQDAKPEASIFPTPFRTPPRQ
jgi:hypothetical protein